MVLAIYMSRKMPFEVLLQHGEKGYLRKSHKILLVGDIFLGLSCVFMIVEAELESRTTNLMRRAPTRTTVPNPIVDGSILLICISVPIRAKMTGSKMIHICKIYQNLSFVFFYFNISKVSQFEWG